MGSERKKYVMGVELAMKREMAYRTKLQRLAIPTCPSKDNIFLSQVPPLTSSQTPMPTPNPHPPPPTPKPGSGSLLRTSAPGSKHHLGRGPRPNPPHHWVGNDHHHHHRKRKEPIHDPEDFFCNLCHVDCTSELNLRMHLKGHKHKAKLKEVKAQGGRAQFQVINTKRPFCDLCGIFCTNEFNLRQHINGKSHKIKLLDNDRKMKG